MIERRADGSIPGEPIMGRIYVAVRDGKLLYCSDEVERESDWPEYIEKSPGFRRYMTEFLPLDELSTVHDHLNATGFPVAEKEKEMAAHLKQIFLARHRECEKAAHAYFAACPEGPERIRASDIYENIRNAIRG